MGLDRFTNFLLKSINNEGIEEININDDDNYNIKKIIANHIIFDIHFLIYQEILEIENEINDIIKIILSLSSNYDNLLENLINIILNQPHWKLYYLENIFDDVNETEIIKNFLNYLVHKDDNNLSILELIIFEKILNTIVKYINNIHYIDIIQNISIFFDGIPSFSKIIEQRKRRIKNYLESNEKKQLYKLYFDNLYSNNCKLIDKLIFNFNKYINIDEKYNNLTFDYLKWIKYKYNVNKSFGPASNFMKRLEIFLDVKLKLIFNKIKIYINSSNENGEADIKIFKFIALNEQIYDYCIHTTDSDFIHQILIQQIYYNIINKDLSLNVIKYIKNTNLYYIQIIDAIVIIKQILYLYSIINNIETNNYKIIWDLCLIFYLFGNDHLVSSIELGPELGLDFYLKCHYNALNKNNIINLKKNQIMIDIYQLSNFLIEINKTNSINITKIILQRYFKININFIIYLTENLKLNYYEILDILKHYIIYKSKQLSLEELNKLDEDDLRKKLNNEDYDKIKINKILNNILLFDENISFDEIQYMGLFLYNKPYNMTNDNYSDLYNIIQDKATNNIYKLYPEYYDHIDLNEHLNLLNKLNNNELVFDTHLYIKKLYHLIITQFGDMKEYYSDNITYYDCNNAPTIKDIINNISSLSNKLLLKEIKNNNISNHLYINNINHHLLISPFIFNYNLSKELLFIINELKCINNLWIINNNIKDFKFKKINIGHFLKKWEDIIKIIHKIELTNLYIDI
jgi:hypothetical protein